MKPLDLLREEHRLLASLLDSLDALLRRARREDRLDPESLVDHHKTVERDDSGTTYRHVVEVPNSLARAALFHDAVLTPEGPPRVDVVATAKIDLEAGQKIDGMGWYMTYGLAENSDVAFRDRLLPMGLAEDCVLKKDVAKDQVLTYDDVTLPAGRLCDRLRREQDRLFFAG